MDGKKSLAAIALLIGFSAIVVLGTHYYLTGGQAGWSGALFKYHFEFMLLIAFGGVAVGAFSYYFMTCEVRDAKQIAKKNTMALLNLLDFDEKKIVEKLLGEKGKARQYELTYAAGLTKVRVHRAVKKLLAKNVVSVEHLGKVNNIKLNKEILEGLSD